MPHIAEETVDCIRGELSSLDYRNIDKAKVEAILDKVDTLWVDEYEEATGGDPSKTVPQGKPAEVDMIWSKLYSLKNNPTSEVANTSSRSKGY